MTFRETIVLVGHAIEAAGVAVVVVGAIAATLNFLRRLQRPNAYEGYRRGLGRSVLLGLELLVAADIIDTVSISPSLDAVMTLGVLVLIRTFLSFSIETELEGRPPWRASSFESRSPPSSRELSNGQQQEEQPQAAQHPRPVG